MNKIRSGLWKSDVFVKDKQNVDAALRILQDEVRICMKEWKDEETIATRVYLKMGQCILRSYTEHNISIKERTRLAWAPVVFLRYWKAWLQLSGYSVDNHFISSQTFDDAILSGHSIILSMKIFSIFFPEQPFQPWTFGSNSCEELFSRLRGFCRGKSNLCMQEMLDLAGRIQKLEELKSNGTKQFENSSSIPGWPESTDEEIKAGMDMAEKEVIKTLELLGMVPALIRGNVLKQEGEDLVCINAPRFDTFAIFDSLEPDENKVITDEELLDLDNGVLLEAIEEDGQTHALVNLAVTASLSNQNQAEMESDSEDDEDDSPKHCALYSSNGCKYREPSFKRPRKTLWMECSFPSCHSWYHEVCLSLKFKTEEEREAYTLICPKHSEIKEQFLDKLTALSSDKHSLHDENTELRPLPQRLKNPAKTRSAEHGIDYSKRPNYVRYEGQYFHMAEFLSLQEGKVYRLSASRLARWIDSARNDFYAKAFEFVNPQRVATGRYLYDIVAMWLPSEGLHVGHIIRIIRSPSLQSHYPVFEWRTDTKAKEKITMCVRVLDFKKVKEDQWEMSTTENFKWCSVRSILKVVGAVDDGKWPIHVDLSQVVEQVPALKEMDKEREAGEEILKKKSER